MLIWPCSRSLKVLQNAFQCKNARNVSNWLLLALPLPCSVNKQNCGKELQSMASVRPLFLACNYGLARLSLLFRRSLTLTSPQLDSLERKSNRSSLSLIDLSPVQCSLSLSLPLWSTSLLLLLHNNDHRRASTAAKEKEKGLVVACVQLPKSLTHRLVHSSSPSSHSTLDVVATSSTLTSALETQYTPDPFKEKERLSFTRFKLPNRSPPVDRQKVQIILQSTVRVRSID
jgi:hypothetical protein